MNEAGFWARVDRSAGPDACWPWTGRRSEKGYGRVELDGLNTRAHRVAHTLTTGPIPDGLIVMHRCDNPPCCNPAHLRVGTVADNQHDMVAKGRSTAGRALAVRPRAPRPRRLGAPRRGRKLTQALVDAIRLEHAGGTRCAVLARRHGVSESVMSRTLRGINWPADPASRPAGDLTREPAGGSLGVPDRQPTAASGSVAPRSAGGPPPGVTGKPNTVPGGAGAQPLGPASPLLLAIP